MCHQLKDAGETPGPVAVEGQSSWESLSEFELMICGSYGPSEDQDGT